VSYFRPQKIRKTGPRSIRSLPDSTQKLSRKGGRVTAFRIQLRSCLEKGVGSVDGTANAKKYYKTESSPSPPSCLVCSPILGKLKQRNERGGNRQNVVQHTSQHYQEEKALGLLLKVSFVPDAL
jgi:hypothetical protein